VADIIKIKIDDDRSVSRSGERYEISLLVSHDVSTEVPWAIDQYSLPVAIQDHQSKERRKYIQLAFKTNHNTSRSLASLKNANATDSKKFCGGLFMTARLLLLLLLLTTPSPPDEDLVKGDFKTPPLSKPGETSLGLLGSQSASRALTMLVSSMTVCSEGSRRVEVEGPLHIAVAVLCGREGLSGECGSADGRTVQGLNRGQTGVFHQKQMIKNIYDQELYGNRFKLAAVR
jgi:hypothetical protein